MSSKNRGTLWMSTLVLVAAVVWVSEKGGSAGLSEVWPKSWRPSAKQGRPTETLPAQGPVLDLQDSFARVAGQAKPTVVSIIATHVERVPVMPEQFYFGDPFEDFFREFHGSPRQGPSQAPRSIERRQQGLGSGVVIDPRGYILTNEHVVRGADELTVIFQAPTERKLMGKVVGADPRSDLAVIKIDPFADLTYAVLGDSQKVRVGDWAIAVGSPFGLEQTVTVGVISAMRQSLNIEGMAYSGLLQTDAAINRGNSGGPLLNIHGEVIGINSAIYAPTGVFAGIGFAIPSNRVKEIMDQLIEKGHVVRGWLGVEIVPVNDVVARQFGLPKAEGVLINAVEPDSPAQRAGLKRGDVIVSFNGEATVSPDQLRDAVGRTAPGKSVKVDIFRDGRRQTLSITTIQMPKEVARRPSDGPEEEAPAPLATEWEGARLVTLTSELAARWGVAPAVRGVAVLEVSPGALAERLGLEPGDVVLSVNRQNTPTVGEFQAAARRVSDKDGVLLDIVRRGRSLFLSFREGQ